MSLINSQEIIIGFFMSQRRGVMEKGLRSAQQVSSSSQDVHLL